MDTMAFSLSSGIFDRWIYSEIIEAGLEGWTPEAYIRRCGSTPYRASPYDIEALSFLSSCCLVSQEWLALARPLLYAGWRIGELTTYRSHPNPPSETLCSPAIAPLVRYLGVHTYIAGESASMVSGLSVFPHLRHLVVGEGSYPFQPFRFLSPYEGTNLTKLTYRSGSVQDLARLMSVLPNLRNLKAGGFMYAKLHLDPPEDMSITCQLKTVSLHHSPRYAPTLFNWMFKPSEDTIPHFAVSRSHKLFKDTLPFLHNAKTLTIEIKSNTTAAKIETDQYDLATNLARFKRLEKLTLRVRHDWPSKWPDTVYAFLQPLYPRVDIRYVQMAKGEDSDPYCSDNSVCEQVL